MIERISLDREGEDWNSIKSWIKAEILKNPKASVDEIYRKVLPRVEEILRVDIFLDGKKLKNFIRAGKDLWAPSS